MSFGSFLKKAKDGLKDVKQGLQDLDKVKENLGKMSISDVGKIFGGDDKHSHTHDGVECHEGASHGEYGANRYSSFAPETTGRAKWYVDGASYFWALSMALEGMLLCRSLLLRSHTNCLQRLESTSIFSIGG